MSMEISKRLQATRNMVAGVVIVSLVVSGCESLRKKFTRQKKKDSEQSDQFIPVLEPEQYPEKVYSPANDYKYHFSLWQVWQKELSTAVFERESNKRQLYMLNQAIVQVDALKKLVGAEKQSGLEEVLKGLRTLHGTIENPAPMHDNFMILNQLKSLDRKMRNNYSFDKIKTSLIE